jgi:hypothetical protein
MRLVEVWLGCGKHGASRATAQFPVALVYHEMVRNLVFSCAPCTNLLPRCQGQASSVVYVACP